MTEGNTREENNDYVVKKLNIHCLSEKQGGGERGKLSLFIDRAYEQIL
jgi:hypothetical protein